MDQGCPSHPFSGYVYVDARVGEFGYALGRRPAPMTVGSAGEERRSGLSISDWSPMDGSWQITPFRGSMGACCRLY